MWIVNAIVVHLLLLGSIFVIYFRSPVITDLRPQLPLPLEPPAKRLVLFITDGLRAESFFKDNCSDVKYLSRLMLQEGLVGLCHTRVPTESRPGHIALIAGLYEDPSAVTRGWKENPVDFDSLFNRSRDTYAWGANDVLHIFSRLKERGRDTFFDAYNHQLDFSGREKTYELDEWVFKRVRSFLERSGAALQNKTQQVFFLHLLGLDSAGHVHKPGSMLFLENLHRTERGVYDAYMHFERIFPDGRTAYVLTSDHGMTDAGSHGAGHPFETETPFFLWGAGIAKSAPNTGRSFGIGAANKLPLHEMEQAQMAPLMSALLGLPPPMNNFGVLPHDFLNVSDEYKARAAHLNALQLLEQYEKLLHENQRGIFSEYLRHHKLDDDLVELYKRETEQMFHKQHYVASLNSSYAIMRDIIEGITYYHGYYRNTLLASTTATFLGWIFYLKQLLEQPEGAHFKSRRSPWPFYVVAASVLGFSALQRTPLVVAAYFTLPVIVWLLALKERRNTTKRQTLPPRQLVLLIISAELLVFSFFERRLISLAFLLFALINHWHLQVHRGPKFYAWLLLVGALAAFPLLPPAVGYTNSVLLLLSMSLTFGRAVLAKSRLPVSSKVISAISLLNAAFCAYQHAHQLGVPLAAQVVSWAFLVYAIANILWNPSVVLKQRVELIFFNLSTLYCLLSTSYEPLFVLMLACELLLVIEAQQQMDTSEEPTSHLPTCFRLAFAILLYTFFSFFGTGNIASVSSFDPNIIRCFLTTFSPFVIMTLVILKLVIPVILSISIIFGISEFARANERQIFICLLIVCDVMGLNFLFLVRNQGSWLEIGSSISHFVIMETTTLVLLMLTLVAKAFLRLNSVSALLFKIK